MKIYVIHATIFLNIVVTCMPLIGYADESESDYGREIIDRVIANRPKNDFSLRARLQLSTDQWEQVEIFINVAGDEVQTIYRTTTTALLVIQSAERGVQLYLRGFGELTDQNRSQPFDKSQFHYYDLGTNFLYWKDPVFVRMERIRGRECYVVESKAKGEPYARVKMWIDQEYFALLRTEAWDKDGRLVKRFSVTSFKKIGESWVPKTTEIVAFLAESELKKSEKSRLEIYDGKYDESLPGELFDPASFIEQNK